MHAKGSDRLFALVGGMEARLLCRAAAARGTKPSTHGDGDDPRSGRASALKTETHYPHDGDNPEVKRSGRSPYRMLQQSCRSTSRERADSLEEARYVSAACGEAPCSSRDSCFGRCFLETPGGSPSIQSKRGAGPSNPGPQQRSLISLDRLAAI